MAKLDIAVDSDSKGRGFESLRAGQKTNASPQGGAFVFSSVRVSKNPVSLPTANYRRLAQQDAGFRIPPGGPEKKHPLSDDKGCFFSTKCSAARNVKRAAHMKRTACVKCAFGTICGTLNFTLRQRRNTSLGRKSKLHCGLPQLH